MICSDHDFPCFLVSLFLTFGPKWGPKSIDPDVIVFTVFRYFSQRSFWGGSGIDFWWMFEDFGRILGGFWGDFGNMLIPVHFGRICNDFACLWNAWRSLALLVLRGAFLTIAGVVSHRWRCSALLDFSLALFSVAYLCWRCWSLLYASVGGSGIDFGWILERFWEDFGNILGICWYILAVFAMILYACEIPAFPRLACLAWGVSYLCWRCLSSLALFSVVCFLLGVIWRCLPLLALLVALVRFRSLTRFPFSCLPGGWVGDAKRL